MNIKIYHKKSKQALTTFDEKTIVDFCLKNKDTLKNYYFSTSGSKEMMEWEVFTVKYSELFEKKAKERDKKEFGESKAEEIKDTKKGRYSPFTIILLALLIATYSTYHLYQKKLEQDARLASQIEAIKPVKEVEKTKMEKRPLKESDTKFVGKTPKEEDLIKLWEKFKDKNLKNALDLNDIKTQMDLYLPMLKECYVKRAKAGDTNIRGTINLKVRVSGDGVVRDVILPDKKYRSTIFGDCIISAIKSKKFKMFKSREQVFTYYWNF